MTTEADARLLDRIEFPADLRPLSLPELRRLCRELRRELIDTVSRTGGHFAAGLGVLELTVALHAVYDTPKDRLIWDVGHQCYPHKMLTGRKGRMHSIRRYGGLSPFPKRGESEYDAFGVGHAGTSIGAALGMAEAARLTGSEHKSVAVIGDGSITCGMAFEALNHAGDLEADLLVVLNDNNMSISPNVGALSNYFTRLISGPVYSSMREGGKQLLSALPPVRELARRAEEHVKGMVTPATLFEEMGFTYYGPIDGHDLPTLVKTLKNLHALEGPRLLHVITQKGHGYEPAEEDPVKWHGVSPFDPETGQGKSGGQAGGPSYTQVFGQWLCDMAEQDERLVGITPAMREGSGLVEFARRFPDRYYDVAIAEQHAVTLAAGLACEGVKPVCAIYSSFLQRGYDQLVHDVALQNLPVLFAIDRAGIVGPDGATHTGSFDLSFLRCIPNLVIMVPADENECRRMLTTGFHHDGPSVVRYPRGMGPGATVEPALTPLPLGKGELRRRGTELAILNFGSLSAEAAQLADRLDASLANMRFIKPLDEALLRSLAANHQALVTVEDNVIQGGAGSAVLEALQQAGVQIPVLTLGLPDRFPAHGSREEILADAGLEADGLERSVRTWLERIGYVPPRNPEQALRQA